jgi:hypothetical protein
MYQELILDGEVVRIEVAALGEIFQLPPVNWSEAEDLGRRIKIVVDNDAALGTRD